MEKPMRQALVTLGQLVDWEVLAERLPYLATLGSRLQPSLGLNWLRPSKAEILSHYLTWAEARDVFSAPWLDMEPEKERGRRPKRKNGSKPRSFPSPTINKGDCLSGQDVKDVL